MNELRGCLYVSFVYEKQLVDDGTHSLIVDAVIAARERLARSWRLRSRFTRRASPST